MELVVLLVVIAAIVGVIAVSKKRSEARALEKKQAELEPVKKLAFEDITALGVELQELDFDLSGSELDEGQRADYQRALDAYEYAKTAGDKITEPEHIRHVTEILEDGKYAIACVRARVAGEPLPTRRPPCFFDPRHGLSVADVPWTPPGGADPRRTRLRARRRAGPRRRRARHPDGDGRLTAGALLRGRPGLPAVRRRATSAPSRRWTGCSPGCCSAASAGSTCSAGSVTASATASARASATASATCSAASTSDLTLTRR